MVLVNFVPSSNTDEDVIKSKKTKKTDTFIINFSNHLVKGCKNRINALVSNSTANVIAIYDCIESDYAA